MLHVGLGKGESRRLGVARNDERRGEDGSTAPYRVHHAAMPVQMRTEANEN
jgi:hypothetical protein